jgi:hypothetical protein
LGPAVWTVLVWVVGCARPAAPPTSAPTSTAQGPRATLRRVLSARAECQYTSLAGLVAPERADDVLQFVSAVDEFLAANQRLCDWLRDHVGLGLSQTVDQAYVADDLATYAGADLGLFSRHVELLDESIVGAQATVTYAIENRLPVLRARLRQVAGAWRYDPGSTCPAELPAAFRDMARGLDALVAELRDGKIDVRLLQGDPEWLMEKVKARLRHGVALLSKAEAARHQQAAAPHAP